MSAGVELLRVSLTGASMYKDPQSNHALSIGNYASSTQFAPLTIHRLNPIRYITVKYVSGFNGTGLGQLYADTTGSLVWTPPGGVQGASVDIANGETKNLYGGSGYTNCYITLERTSALPLGGTETIQLLDTVNNAVGGSNFTGAQATAGAAKYRCLSLENLGTSTMSDITIWLDLISQSNTQIAVEEPTSNQYSVISTELIQPSGLSWSAPTTEGTGIVIPTLAVGADYGLWIERYIAALTDADPLLKTIINIAFTYEGTKHYQRLRGASRIANTITDIYQLYIGEDTDPGIDGTPTDEFASLPYTITTLTNSHSWNIRLTQTNQYGLKSPSTELEVITLDSEGNQLYEAPSAPSPVRVTPVAGGFFKVEANYNAMQDDHPADTWLIYYTYTGATPNPSLLTPVEVDMDNSAMLSWTSSTHYVSGTVIKVIVRTMRSSDEIESTNTDYTEATISVYGPGAVIARASIGLAIGVDATPINGDETYYVDEAKDIAFIQTETGFGFWADTLLIWNIKASSAYNPVNGIHTVFTRKYGTVSGACTGTVVYGIEIAEWTVGSKVLYVAVDDAGVNKRAVKIDVTNQIITVPLFRPATLEDDSLSDDPGVQHAGYTLFQDYDEETDQFMTAMCIALDGQLGTATYVPWRTHATQEECL